MRQGRCTCFFSKGGAHRFIALALLSGVSAISAAQAPASCVSFPTQFTFASVYSVTTPNSLGDMLVVGRMTISTFHLLQEIPFPSAVNQQFCGSVLIAPGMLAQVYVPTAAERVGDFSYFGGPLFDPSTGNPFPGNIIPLSRLPDPFALRVSSVSAVVLTPVLNGVRSVANGATPNPPGSLIYAQGASLAFATIIASSTPLPTHLQANFDDVSVTINGIPAPMYYVLPNYVSFQLPWETDVSTGSATMIVTHNGIASAPLQFPVGEFSPGIYTTSGNGSGMAWAIFAAPSKINPNGQVAQAVSVGSYPGVPATAGDLLYIYAAGLGPAKNMEDGRAPCSLANNRPGSCPAGYSAADYSTITTPSITIGGVQAKVDAAILDPTYPGLYLVFFEIPANAPKGNAVPIQLQIPGGPGTDPANVTIAIQ